VQRFHRVDIAVAAERDIPGAEGCAFIDIIRDADQKPLKELTTWLRALATCTAETNAQWRAFSTLIRRAPHFIAKWLLRLPLWAPSLWVKYRGGAVLISSPAKYGVDGVATTWPWPVGFSFGLVSQRPIVKDGQIVAAPTCTLTLNFDRRLMAGAQGAKFFDRVADLLTNATKDLATVGSQVQLAA